MTSRCAHAVLRCPVLSQLISATGSLQAGGGCNTFIPAGTNHSSAAVFPPLSAPHLFSDIGTTVAVRVCPPTHDDASLEKSAVRVSSVISERRPLPLHLRSGSRISAQITVRLLSSPWPPFLPLLLGPDNRGAQCARSDHYTGSSGGNMPTRRFNSQITQKSVSI